MNESLKMRSSKGRYKKPSSDKYPRNKSRSFQDEWFEKFKSGWNMNWMKHFVIFA